MVGYNICLYECISCFEHLHQIDFQILIALWSESFQGLYLTWILLMQYHNGSIFVVLSFDWILFPFNINLITTIFSCNKSDIDVVPKVSFCFYYFHYFIVDYEVSRR